MRPGRRGSAEPETQAKESLASLQGPMGAVPGRGQRPPPRAFPDSPRGRGPRGAGGTTGNGARGGAGGGRLAQSIAAGNSGLAFSVRAPGLPASPSPRPRLALSDGDTAGGVLRSRRGNPEPPGAAGASSRPRAGRARRGPPAPAWQQAGRPENPTGPGPVTQAAQQELDVLSGPWGLAQWRTFGPMHYSCHYLSDVRTIISFA